MAQPLLLDLKRNSLDDGPGIRSVVFFKGCPLTCDWCQNPEAISTRAELQRDVAACDGCSGCLPACPQGVARPAALAEDRDSCQRCGACVDACPSAARRIAGQALSRKSVLAQLLLDEPFYRRSGGGVTLSGGEPTLFPDFAGDLAADLTRAGVHVLLETCGLFAYDRCAEVLLPHVSKIYFDLKLADPAAHQHHCGASRPGRDKDQPCIVENLERLVAAGHEVLPRIPLVPGITDDPDNLEAIAMIIRRAGLQRVALLPYNPLWISKRRGIGMPLPYAHDAWMTPAELAACEQTIEAQGLEVVR